MKKKSLKQLMSLVLGVMFIPLFISCNKKEDIPKPDIKKENKISKVKIITHDGHLHPGFFHANAQPKNSPWLRKQEIILEKTDEGWKQEATNIAKGKVSVFSALGTNKGAKDLIKKKMGGATSLEMIFYDKDGKVLNQEYTDNAKKIQIFFTTSNCVNNETKKAKDANITDLIYQYTYRDTNPAEKMYTTDGVSLLQKEDSFKGYANIGMKGYFVFKVGKVSYDLNIHVVEWKNTDKPINLSFDKLPKENKGVEITTFSIPINILFTHPWTDAEEAYKFEALAKYYGGLTAEEFEDIEYNSDIDPESEGYKM